MFKKKKKAMIWSEEQETEFQKAVATLDILVIGTDEYKKVLDEVYIPLLNARTEALSKEGSIKSSRRNAIVTASVTGILSLGPMIGKEIGKLWNHFRDIPKPGWPKN